MIEKVMLAIAITCALYWSVQIKPQPKVLTIDPGYSLEILVAV